ncbi:cupin domain-containing protein [Cellulomonas sp. PhB150]|uniref:cupin domain-containing protein n=1 Tax=Cellulomonas sp. PhB150 TaxID=2485188 RepID=UPI000F498508|nr:cupin domain-containing protein [Cellulomonas sp. PhB150]ROS31103.1 cupin superfamily protein [Cellulomonas sp. PhB150]
MAGSSTGRGSALGRCLGTSPETFARDHWGTAPLLSRAGTLGDGGFTDLFSVEAVDELVARRGVRTPFVRMAKEGSVLPAGRFTGPAGYGAEVGDQLSSEKVLAEFGAGATIVLQGLHRLWPPLIDFTRRLVAEIGHPAQVNAYVTPPSSRGFDAHYDTHDVFVLQVAGEKHWRIHSPVHVDPLADQPWSAHADDVARAAQGEPVIDAVLTAGDALYLPRGWIHSAEALGDTSVHLTVGMSAYTRADVVDALLGLVGDTPALRSSLPLGVDVSDPEELRPIVDSVLADLANALAQRSDRAAELVAKGLGSRFEQQTRPEPVGPVQTLAAAALLTTTHRVRLREALGASVEDADDTVRLRARGRALVFPAEAGPALRHLLTGEPVAVGDLPGLDAASAVVVARRLLREGYVVTAG